MARLGKEQAYKLVKVSKKNRFFQDLVAYMLQELAFSGRP